MPLPWKKSKPGRVSKPVSNLQESQKHDGSLVVEAGFSTSHNDSFAENHDRIKKPSSKRSSNHSHLTRRRVSPPPPPPSLSLQPHRLLPQKLEPESVTEDPAVSKIEESSLRCDGDGGLTGASSHDGDDEDDSVIDCKREGGGYVLVVVVFKVFVVVALALSTKKLAVGITLSALAFLFLELVVARVFVFLNLCPDAQVRLDLLIKKFIGKQRQEKIEKSSQHERRNKVSFEKIGKSCDCSEEIGVAKLEKKVKWNDLLTKYVGEEKEVQQTMRDVVFKNEKSKSSKLKSKIVKKIVPKKLRSYKKKKKMKIKKQEGVVEEEEDEEEGSVTDVSSLSSEEVLESENSEGDEISTNPLLIKSCEEEGCGSKATVLIVIVLAGLLSGKVLAIGLALSWCLILRVVCCKSQTSL